MNDKSVKKATIHMKIHLFYPKDPAYDHRVRSYISLSFESIDALISDILFLSVPPSLRILKKGSNARLFWIFFCVFFRGNHNKRNHHGIHVYNSGSCTLKNNGREKIVSFQ